MNKSILVGTFSLLSALNADEDFIAAAQKMNKQTQGQMSDSVKNAVTLTSARPESDYGWYLFADALYWHLDIGSTDWANANKITNPVPARPSVSSTTANNHSLNFKWNWGYRVGIGSNIDYDKWDTNFHYTWLFADNSNKVGRDGVIIIDQFGIGGGLPFAQSSTKWDFHFSMLDWEFGRWTYLSKNLTFRPHAGVKGGWIHWKGKSKFNVTSSNAQGQPFGILLQEKFQNNFWGVGPSLGLNTMWVLGNIGKAMEHRFSLFGDIAGALMYGHFDIINKQIVVNPFGGLLANANQKGLSRNLAVPMLQVAMGLSYDTDLNRGKHHFLASLGYEFQYWYRQNQLIISENTGNNGLVLDNQRIADDLALQGITAEFRFDF